MPACVGGEESGAFSRDELGLQEIKCISCTFLVQSRFSPSLATCLSVLPDGAVMIKGRKQRGRKVRKMLKDNVEVRASQKLVKKK